MGYDPVITLCLFKRPDYADQVFKHLANCDGIDKYTIVMCVDGPPNHRMVRLCKSVRIGKKQTVLVSNHNLGCNGNTRRALRCGFQLSDYVIHVEEDIILAPDALLYFEWGRRFENDKSIITIGAWRHPKGWLPEHGPFPEGKRIQAKVCRHPGVWIWGFATWRDRWEDADKHWTTQGDKELSWDTCWTQHRAMTNRVALIPLVSRAQNIGEKDGTHTGATINSYWAGSNGFKRDLDFHVIQSPEEL